MPSIMENIPRWHIVTSDEFKLGTKVETDLYFLSDTKEIYRGEVSFTESVILYTELPATGIAINRLYINSTTLEGKIYNGTDWTTVIKPVDITINADSLNPASSKAVAAYVAAEIAKVSTSGDVINALSWDSAEHILTVTKGDTSTENITFKGLGVDLQYNSTTGNLQLVDASGTAIGSPIKLDLERFVTSGEYDPETKEIKLYFDAEKTSSVSIPVGELVDTYTAEGDGKALTLNVTNNKISGSIKISTAEGNIITADENGLYVQATDISGKMDKATDAVEGNIAVFDANGNVLDSEKNFDDIVPNNSVYTGETLEDAITGKTPIKGDIVIVSTQIGSTSKYQKTVYQYDGESWKAFDESYNAENVYFAQDLITTSAIGNITLTNGQATIAAAGKNLKQVFDTIFVKEKNPKITQPSVAITANANKAYEVGTTVTPTYTATLNAGSYEFGPATGIAATSWNITDSNSATKTTNTGSFDAFVVDDSTNYTITATATYGDGAIPKTNVGNDYAAGKIVAGSKSKSSAAITGFRKGFYGTLTSKEDLTSDIIRGLDGKTTIAPAVGNKWTLNIPAGAQRVVFAYPATIRNVSSVTDRNGMNAEINTAFTMSQMDIEGANGHTAIAYKVYVLDFATPADVANAYTITL